MKTLKAQWAKRLPIGCIAGVVSLLFCLAPGAQAQKDTIHVPVTFYDFRSDRTNPEFEQPHGTYGSDANQASYYENWTGNSIEEVRNNVRAHNRFNMVDSLLDRDGKPRLGRNPYLNHGVRFWFRDWSNLNQYSAKDSTVGGQGYLVPFRPIYTYNNVRSEQHTNVLPPTKEQSARAAGIRGDASDWDDGTSDGEWEARPNTGMGIPYAYNNSTVTVPGFDGGAARTATASGGRVTIDGREYTINDAFQNKVVESFLVFNHTGGGRYRYDDKRFFPMDGKGFETVSGNAVSGRDWATSGAASARTNLVNNHNFSFTMELVWDFKMEDGLSFNFRGDDDVWVFINGKLAMDIGGIHNPYEAGFNLNSMRASHNLVNGNTYKMHMFYSERHSNGSSILIETNIISDVLTQLNLKVDGDTLTAGDSIPAYAVVGTDSEDGKGVLKDYSKGRFTWSARDVGGYNTGNMLRVSPRGGRGSNPLITKADTVFLYAEKAYTTIMLTGEFCDTTSVPQQCVRDSIPVFVKAGAAAQVSVEGAAVSLSSPISLLQNRTDLDTIRITSGAPSDSNFYAVLRDRFGNWVSAAYPETGANGRTLTWSPENRAIATARTSANARLGQGVAERVTTDAGATRLFVEYVMPNTNPSLTARLTFRDTSVISIENITYVGIRIGVMSGTQFIPLTTPSGAGVIRMTIPSDTTLYVQVKRSDNGDWVVAPVVTWSQASFTPSLTDLPSPATASNYVYRARTPQNGGVITVSVPGGGSDYVTIISEYSDAAAVRFFNRRGTPTFDNPITEFPQTGNPAGVRPYPIPSQVLTVRAGDNVPIVAALFAALPPTAATFLADKQGAGLTSGSITWSVFDAVGNPLTGSATAITTIPAYCDSAVFRSTVALYGTDYYIVRATYNGGSTPITQDLRVRVNPGEPKKVWIEPNSRGREASPNKGQRFPDDVLTFTESDSVISVYAVLRDEWENFIGFSGGSSEFYPNVAPNGTRWSTNPTGVVSAESGYVAQGEGIVIKLVRDAETVLTAVDGAWLISGSVKVKIVDYSYTELRVVTKNPDGSINIIEDLDMTTNDDTTLIVQGKRSDNDEWEEVSVTWDREDPGLTYVLTDPPRNTSTWDLSPGNTGKGRVTVSRIGSGGKTIYKDINVTVKLGPPTRAELEITTPADQIIAGKEITAVVRYYNKQGLLTSWDPSWTGPDIGGLVVNFADVLAGEHGEKDKWIPKVNSVIGENELYNKDRLCVGACYNATLNPTDGSATVTFIIYNATDNPHQIQLKQTIVANGQYYTVEPLSQQFIVRAGDPSKIKIESNNLVDDTLRLRYDDPDEILHAVAEDEYGNRVGDYPSNWDDRGDGSPVKVSAKDAPLLVYRPGAAEGNGTGQVCAVPVINGVPVEGKGDCITVIISGVVTYALSVTTRDTDGCGYLDRIDLKFPKPIDLTDAMKAAGGKPGNLVTVTHGDKTTIEVDYVTANPADNTAVVYLKETHTGELQTGWKPKLIIKEGVFEEAGGPRDGYVCIDGAAPVISTARLFFPSTGTGAIAENYIQVKFSEDVLASNGLSFKDAKFTPSELFVIYELSGAGKRLAKSKSSKALAKAAHNPETDINGSFTPLPDKLAGISQTMYENNNTVRFYLENSEEIGPPHHWINIKTSAYETPGSHVLDVPLNVPKSNNRKVPVLFGNEPNQKAVAIPNPASPDRDNPYAKPGVINVKHEPTAVNYIKGGGGGTVLEVPIYVPKSGSVKCQLKVYDLAGNLVISGEGDKMEQGLAERGAYDKLHLYWNGFNSKAMKVAPGTYRMVVYVSYSNVGRDESDKAKNKKLPPVTVGMSK